MLEQARSPTHLSAGTRKYQRGIWRFSHTMSAAGSVAGCGSPPISDRLPDPNCGCKPEQGRQQGPFQPTLVCTETTDKMASGMLAWATWKGTTIRAELCARAACAPGPLRSRSAQQLNSLEAHRRCSFLHEPLRVGSVLPRLLA